MEKMTIYEALRYCPPNAQKKIGGGRLKGMTDINPMWRIKVLTETFGPVGIGWAYSITKQWLEPGNNGEVAAFVDIELRIKVNDQWSEPIPGTGGAMFVSREKSGLYTDDEAYKKALTDALSVACKALGVAADIYWDNDRSKYSEPAPAPAPAGKVNPSQVAQLESLITETRSDRAKLLAFFKVARLEDMSVDQHRRCMIMLTKKLEPQ